MFKVYPNLGGRSTDERLKYGVKRNFFTNKSEVDYDSIEYELL